MISVKLWTPFQYDKSHMPKHVGVNGTKLVHNHFNQWEIMLHNDGPIK